MHAARISFEDYHRLCDFVHEHRLGYLPGQSPVPLFPLLTWLGWQVVRRDDMTHLGLYALATRGRHVKIVYVNQLMDCGSWRSCYAHMLAHEALGTVPVVDEMVPFDHEHLRRIPIDQEVEDAARAAQSMILIPEAFVVSGFSPEELSAYCLCTLGNVERRLHGIAIGSDDHAVLRFERRGPGRSFVRERLERYTATSD